MLRDFIYEGLDLIGAAFIYMFIFIVILFVWYLLFYVVSIIAFLSFSHYNPILWDVGARLGLAALSLVTFFVAINS